MVFDFIVGLSFLLEWIVGIQKFYARKLHLFQIKSVLTSALGDHRRSPKTGRTDDTVRIEREDLVMVMEKLGIMGGDGDGDEEEEEEELTESMGVDELESMFEEKEPSMEELEKAFLVYDKNRDGFIDADELQAVLSNLGFFDGKRSSSLSSVEEACRRMIANYDENKDGKIDFSEFLRIDFC